MVCLVAKGTRSENQYLRIRSEIDAGDVQLKLVNNVTASRTEVESNKRAITCRKATSYCSFRKESKNFYTSKLTQGILKVKPPKIDAQSKRKD